MLSGSSGSSVDRSVVERGHQAKGATSHSDCCVSCRLSVLLANSLKAMIEFDPGWLRRIVAVLGAPLGELHADHIRALAAAAISEASDLEFKESLYGGADRDKQELCKDIAGMRNATGGVIVLGVSEKRSVAASCPGVGLSDAACERSGRSPCRDPSYLASRSTARSARTRSRTRGRTPGTKRRDARSRALADPCSQGADRVPRSRESLAQPRKRA